MLSVFFFCAARKANVCNGSKAVAATLGGEVPFKRYAEQMTARAEQIPVQVRIVIETPVPGVLHSLQSKDGHPLDPKVSQSGEPLTFDFRVRVAPGPKFFGDQVRREGPTRRFVYIRIGQSAGDPSSPWSRRMKIDIHDLEQDLLDRATGTGRVVELTVDGTGKDGSPACATVRPTHTILA